MKTVQKDLYSYPDRVDPEQAKKCMRHYFELKEREPDSFRETIQYACIYCGEVRSIDP